jgi:hypothetical protein
MSGDGIKIARNGKASVGSSDYLAQLKIVGNEARIVDHLDHIPGVPKCHIITDIKNDGSTSSRIQKY